MYSSALTGLLGDFILGRILSSAVVILGMVAIPEASAYNASKGGVIRFTRSIAVEYGRHNIRANSI